eukprot:CAMPEP_0118870106 /NCGR_PEP_ID=MMETSP1163-20130328/13198_1 /TAXON_ID=124430 /ORGANISM="Phaeomonas parva, Strain CCMP2877" /LENGTH=185 /DNA_ID=CAMNT_0006805057 /DNA_START=350 /DNA_END=903 /DNA_ORIENTATION=+
MAEDDFDMQLRLTEASRDTFSRQRRPRLHRQTRQMLSWSKAVAHTRNLENLDPPTPRTRLRPGTKAPAIVRQVPAEMLDTKMQKMRHNFLDSPEHSPERGGGAAAAAAMLPDAYYETYYADGAEAAAATAASTSSLGLGLAAAPSSGDACETDSGQTQTTQATHATAATHPEVVAFASRTQPNSA